MAANWSHKKFENYSLIQRWTAIERIFIGRKVLDIIFDA